MAHLATPKDTPYIEILELPLEGKRFQWTICIRTFSGRYFRTSTTGREETPGRAAEVAHETMLDPKFRT